MVSSPFHSDTIQSVISLISVQGSFSIEQSANDVETRSMYGWIKFPYVYRKNRNLSSNAWMPMGTTTLTSITWQSSNVSPQTAPILTISTAATYYYNVSVYSLSFVFKDNSNTTTNGLSSGSYVLQNGTFQITAIIWQGNTVTPSPSKLRPIP